MTAFRSPLDLRLTKTPVVPIEEFQPIFDGIFNALRTLQISLGDLTGVSYSSDPTYFHESAPGYRDSIKVQSLQLIRVPVSVSMVAGEFINLHNNAGALNARKADATAIGTRAHGWMMETVVAPNYAMIALQSGHRPGAGMAIATTYYLSSITPGGISAAIPVGSGKIIQEVGVALSATELFVNISTPIVIP